MVVRRRRAPMPRAYCQKYTARASHPGRIACVCPVAPGPLHWAADDASRIVVLVKPPFSCITQTGLSSQLAEIANSRRVPPCEQNHLRRPQRPGRCNAPERIARTLQQFTLERTAGSTASFAIISRRSGHLTHAVGALCGNPLPRAIEIWLALVQKLWRTEVVCGKPRKSGTKTAGGPYS